MKLIRLNDKKFYFPTSAKDVKKLILDNNLKVGWPVKCGRKWDICYTDLLGNKIMKPTGLYCLSLWSTQEWVDWIKQNCV